MGCDIHGYWEVRDHTGDWMAIKHLDNTRDYLWFGIIAGVRHPVEWDVPSAPWGRGFPSDASSAWSEYSKDSELHSATWLTPPEVRRANEIYKKDEIYKKETDSHFMTPRRYWQAQPGPEDVPGPTTFVEKLYLGYNWYSRDSPDITLPWCGTVSDLICKDRPFEECVRLVVGFDS